MEWRDFFISYTKSDKEWALWVAKVLKDNGYSVYVQALDIRPGEDFLEKMEEFLENSVNFIAVWSESYSKSKYCMNELRAAYHQWHYGLMNCLLPVKIDSYPIKALYAALVHVDLSDMSAASEKTLTNAVRRSVPHSLREEDEIRLYLSGKSYYYGNDYIRAKNYWEQAVQKGNADAMFGLGVLYYSGNGVEKNYAKARDYWEQAADKGNADALFRLGKLYCYGDGVEQSYTKAWNYYTQAAAKDNASALFELGQLYEYGHGVDIDYAMALYCYQRAVVTGDPEAPAKVEEMRKKLNEQSGE